MNQLIKETCNLTTRIVDPSGPSTRKRSNNNNWEPPISFSKVLKQIHALFGRQHLGKKIMREHELINISKQDYANIPPTPTQKNKSLIRKKISWGRVALGKAKLAWLIFHPELNNSFLNIPITVTFLFHSCSNLPNANLAITGILQQLTRILNFN